MHSHSAILSTRPASAPRANRPTPLPRGAWVAAFGLSLASVATGQSASQFHYGTMGAPHNTGVRPVLLGGIEFRDRRLPTSRVTLQNRVFGTSTLSAKRHLEAMSFQQFTIQPFHGLGFVGPYTMRDDPDTLPDESLSAHALWTPTSTAPILYFGVQTAGGRFMQATGGGGGGLRIGGATSVGDPSRTPWEVFALKDLNGGRLQHGDLVAIKTASGHWWRQQGQYVNADAIRLGLGTFFFVYKASGSGAIEQNDRFHLVAMNGYYVRALGNVTTANATSPLSYGTFTMQRTSVDSMRLGQELVTQTRLSWGASFRALDTDRNGVLEAHECVLAMYFADLIGDGGAHRGFSTSTVPGESGLRISTSLLYLYDRTNISTITHELTHTLGTDDVYGSGGRYNYRVSLMGATIDGNPTLRVHLDCWHRMRLGWVVPRIIPMVGYNGAEVLRAVSSNVASWENRPIILYDPGRYSLGSRSGEFFMLEARTRVSGYYDESLATEGLAVWQIKTNSAGQLLAITEGKSLLVQSADGRRDGSTLFQEQDGVITPRYYDGQAAAVRLRVSRPYATQPERMVVEISRDGAMVPVITGVSGSLTVGSTLNVFGELSPQSGAYPLVLMNVAGGGGSFSLSPTRHGTYWSVTIPSWAPIGAYDLQARQWGRYSTSRRITLR